MSVDGSVLAVFRLRIVQLLALGCLLAALAGLGMEAGTSVRDPDIWWHVKVGDWIVQNHAVPHTGIFSRTAGDRSWVAYSWGYEVLQSRAYAWFGLMGFAIYGIAVTLAVAWTLFWMVQRLCGEFWRSWALCALGSLAFLFSLMPRPVFFSMILFMVTLSQIFEAERTGWVRPLYWLIPLFALWANLHIQFIYGLFALGLFAGSSMAYRAAERFRLAPEWWSRPALPAMPLVAVLAGGALGACVGPYSFHLYEVVLKYSQSRTAYAYIQELQPLDYKAYSDYLLVLVVAAGFLALGWRRKFDLFRIGLMTIAAVFAFRTSRDAWFAGVCAVAFLAEARGQRTNSVGGLKLAETVGVWALAAFLVSLIGANLGFTPRELDRSISRTYPVDAVNFLRRNPAPGPLYNSLDWGGFLIWYMPQYPVSIDGRNDLYGDEFDARYFRSLDGDYAGDPSLKDAGLVLLPKTEPLATLLTLDPQFQLIYEDQIARVFVRK